jgi:CheY-like chemotaxis protein
MTSTSDRILVIDDERPIRKLLQIGLSTQGYKIIEASTGRDSLHLLSQKPALIILDLGLPDIQGFELLRKPAHAMTVFRSLSCQAVGTRTARSKRSISVLRLRNEAVRHEQATRAHTHCTPA